MLVLDCDQTLWRGVCGEDGPLGVVIDPPRRALQEFAIAQREAGMLLCLCSKNSEEDVFSVFDGHPDMLLRREHLAGSRINWRPKSENLRSLAEELNVGLDSFILLDDNPLECAEVRARHPEVLALTLPQDPARISFFLEHVWAFDRLAGTAEDAQRANFYRQNTARERLRGGSLTFGDFIESLALDVRLFRPERGHLARVAQLTRRTNQFNNSSLRRQEQEIEDLLGSGRAECVAVEVRDRFGDYGLVGVVIFRIEGEALTAESLLLSCRALGRGVEHRMVAWLGEQAVSRGVRWVEIPYIDTGRNQPARHFLEEIGGGPITRDDGSRLFRIEGSAAATVRYRPEERSEVSTEESRTLPSPPSSPARADSARRRADVDRLIDVATNLHSVEPILARINAERRRPRPPLAAAFGEPRTDLQRKLTEIWAEALGLDRVGIDDDFFELGGTSLQATIVVNRLEQELGQELEASLIFDTPTVAALTERLRVRGAAAAIGAIRRTEAGARDRRVVPCSFAQQRLWFLDQFEPGNPVYNERQAIRLRGALRQAELRQALAAIVARHESLRTDVPDHRRPPHAGRGGTRSLAPFRDGPR